MAGIKSVVHYCHKQLLLLALITTTSCENNKGKHYYFQCPLSRQMNEVNL
jgi:hypothetical protein